MLPFAIVIGTCLIMLTQSYAFFLKFLIFAFSYTHYYFIIQNTMKLLCMIALTAIRAPKSPVLQHSFLLLVSAFRAHYFNTVCCC